MTVYDVIEISSDYTDVVVYDAQDVGVANYDGRDAIPEQYNTWQVEEIRVDGGALLLYTSGEVEK